MCCPSLPLCRPRPCGGIVRPLPLISVRQSSRSQVGIIVPRPRKGGQHAPHMVCATTLGATVFAGASLRGETVTSTVIASVPPLPSETWTTKLSAPFQFAAGV